MVESSQDVTTQRRYRFSLWSVIDITNYRDESFALRPLDTRKHGTPFETDSKRVRAETRRQILLSLQWSRQMETLPSKVC
jgi:hypothetical protein